MEASLAQKGNVDQSYVVLHADLFVRSIDVALEFYCTKLGFSVVEDATFRGPIVRTFSNDSYEAVRLVLLRVSRVGAMIELVQFLSESALRENSHDLAFRTGWVAILVTDLKAHIESMRSRGLQTVGDIFTITLPRIGTCEAVFYKDPDGNGLEFLQMQD